MKKALAFILFVLSLGLHGFQVYAGGPLHSRHPHVLHRAPLAGRPVLLGAAAAPYWADLASRGSSLAGPWPGRWLLGAAAAPDWAVQASRGSCTPAAVAARVRLQRPRGPRWATPPHGGRRCRLAVRQHARGTRMRATRCGRDRRRAGEL